MRERKRKREREREEGHGDDYGNGSDTDTGGPQSEEGKGEWGRRKAKNPKVLGLQNTDLVQP